MPISYVAGDLFANQYQIQALAHGCNCQGAMGAGIAKTFRARYPAMYTAYRQRCLARPRQFNLGDVFLWKDGQPWVFNLATQERYGHGQQASYEAIAEALRAMRQLADQEDIRSIAMPRIGAGLGGGGWDAVRVLIEQAFADWPGVLYVFETYQPAAPLEAVG